VLKERDILDLYFIRQSGTDVFKVDNQLIFNKIKSGILVSPDLIENLKKNCQLLQDDAFGRSDDDIHRLILVEINNERYENFKDLLYGKLKEICKMGKI